MKCGCTEKRACIQFDADGYAYACHWALQDVCSACFFDHPPPYFDGETRLLVALYRGKKKITPAQYKRQFLCAPALAGMVARPRR